MNNRIITLSFFTSIIGLIGCAKTSFEVSSSVDPAPPEKQSSVLNLAKEFKLKPIQEKFEQSNLNLNETVVRFQVSDKNNLNVVDYKASDIKILENGKAVQKYDVQSANENEGFKTDIVFVMDITNSMAEPIDEAKNKVRAFAKKMSEKKVNGRFCLVAFRDATVKKCTEIVEDNPGTAVNENLEAFVKELDALKTKPSGESDENQLRGLIDAAVATPWRNNAQRIAILITNSGFAYAPENKGDAGEDAPTYKETFETMINQSVQVFAVAPKKAGYSKEFGNLPSLTSGTDGEHFEFEKVIGGASSFDKVYDRILSRLLTTYTLRFTSEENGLDPHLPLSDRKIVISSARSQSDKVRVVSTSGVWPFGKPFNSSTFLLKDSPTDVQLGVKVNGQTIASGFKIKGASLEFDDPPADGSLIEVQYVPKNYVLALNLVAISLPINLILDTLTVVVNDKPVPLSKLKLSTTSSEIILNPRFLLDSARDEFGVLSRGGLVIKIDGTVLVD